MISFKTIKWNEKIKKIFKEFKALSKNVGENWQIRFNIKILRTLQKAELEQKRNQNGIELEQN